MHSLQPTIWNGRMAPCEHDSLKLTRVGSCQPHGLIIVCNAANGRVEHVSANVDKFLAISPKGLIGNLPTIAFHDTESLARMQEILQPGRQFFDNPIPVSANGHHFEAICHLQGEHLYIELEPTVDATHEYDALLATSIEAMSRQTTLRGLYDAAVDMMQFITGWDRVKLYKFMHHGHGQTVAERRSATCKLPSFDTLWFPATDIPIAAREQLRKGRTRQKVTQRRSVPMLTLDAGGSVVESGPVLDMQDCWLRGVHVSDQDYNRSINVDSLIIFPAVQGEALWGLFLVHNEKEAFLPYNSRVAIEQLTMMFISKLNEIEALEAYKERRERSAADMLQRIEAGQEMLRTAFAHRNEPGEALRLQTMHTISRHLAALAPTYVSATGADLVYPDKLAEQFSTDLMRLARADGVAVVRSGPGGHVHLVGDTPEAMVVRGIATMFGSRLPSLAQAPGQVFATDALCDFVPLSDAVKKVACGLLAAPLGTRGDMIMWFRKEVVHDDAHWAGPPPHPSELMTEKLMGSRTNFDPFHQPIGGSAPPWLECDIEVAGRFAAAVSEMWENHRSGRPAPRMEPQSYAPDPTPAPAQDVGAIFGIGAAPSATRWAVMS